MKKTLKLILPAALILFVLLGCSQPDSNPKNENIYTLEHGSSVNTLFQYLGGKEAVALLPSRTAPAEDEKIKYIDIAQKNIAVWYDKNHKTLYFYAKNVTTENSKMKIFLNEDSRCLFYKLPQLLSIDLSCFDTTNVTNMAFMFCESESLTELNLSNFDTSNVTDMKGMFSDCNTLTELDLSNFDTSNVTYMIGMFFGCSALTTLDLSNFDTSKVTAMDAMFLGCSALSTLNLSSFDTSNVGNMDEMFYGCEALTELDLSNFDTSNVTNMSHMFSWCNHLQKIYVSNNFTTKNLSTNIDMPMFWACYNLTGGKGTSYSSEHTDAVYARIDGYENLPGYFTDITDKI